jgi:hypothetical protein
MTAETDDSRRLQEVFSSLAPGARPPEGCPAADRIWAALRGELPAREVRGLVDHTASCPACAEAWRLAVAVERETAEETPAEPVAAAGGWNRRWAMAATAALALLVVGIQLWTSDGRDGRSEYRQGQEVAFQSLVSEDQPLPRDDAWLRWSGIEGARYDLEVTSETLDVLASAQGLEVPGFQVPEEAFSGLAPGSWILWRVDASLPDGSRRRSPTFRHRLE